MPNIIRKLIGPVLILLSAFWATTAVAAMDGDSLGTSGQSLTVELNEGKLIRLNSDADSVFIANPGVADVSVKSPRLVYLFGKQPGETSLFAVDNNENVIANMRILVTHNLSRLKSGLDRLVPEGTITPISVEGGIILTGQVPTGVHAEDARRLAAHFVGENEEVINQLAVTAPNQINLRVRFAEVSRAISNDLGFDWTAAYMSGDFAFGIASALDVTGLNGSATVDTNNFDLNLLIDALASDNLVSLLAEPNLTTLSGETASFLAGGEFPIPVNQSDDTITIEFKDFGVSLAFTPTILSDNRISMRVRPEVSAIANLQEIPGLVGFQIPTLDTRRAETTVELGSGQSFAIAGLIQDSARQAAEQLPGLGDLPILGQLFRSDSFQANESELVIVVTPYIVQPVNPDQIVTPLDALQKRQPEPGLGYAPVANSQVIPLQEGAAKQFGARNGNVGFIVE
jgi:pilus assembly protein CpaC